MQIQHQMCKNISNIICLRCDAAKRPQIINYAGIEYIIMSSRYPGNSVNEIAEPRLLGPKMFENIERSLRLCLQCLLGDLI